MTTTTFLTAAQMEELDISSKKGYADRAEFYYKYYLMTGSRQALLQAQITTYSGPIGGLALFGNYLAKTQDQDLNGNQINYGLTLDQFTMDIREGFIAAGRIHYTPTAMVF